MVSTVEETGMVELTIDSSHSSAEFAVKHMMFTTVRGRFSEVTGTVRVDPSDIANSSVSVAINAGSITTGDDKRDEHLRSPDFFDVNALPTITFESSAVKPTGDGSFDLEGILTMHDVSQPVVIKAESGGRGTNPWGQTVYGFSGSTKVNRKNFGLTWNVALETGGMLVSEDVTITLEIQAAQQ